MTISHAPSNVTQKRYELYKKFVNNKLEIINYIQKLIEYEDDLNIDFLEKFCHTFLKMLKKQAQEYLQTSWKKKNLKN